ncbi:MAG: GNAT family N-acetyltransferase [Bacteroidia bacterium]|nr:GNAT family N-acetyltransferase [Bacteroidia bacterium]
MEFKMVDAKILLKSALRPIVFRPAPDLPAGAGVSLRSLQLEDLNRLFDLIEQNRYHLQRWLSWIQSIQTMADCKNFLFSVNYKSVYSGKWVFGIWYGAELVGLLDMNEPNSNKKEISIGYWIAEAFQGKGIVSRAVTCCMDYLFTEKKVEKIIIKCATENHRSKAIAQRLGFEWESVTHDAGQVNGRWVDLDKFVMEKQVWFNKRNLK